ncbi:MAG: hypothetical protein Q8K66_10035, partial [Sediminibacterium sp.]|nr:hypothetical protein [Sediminibacterium sp.]MDP3129406.1 hypothetical protein [Sediminibacterium sp.]
MKRLYLIAACILLLKMANSQTILPLQSAEYCPNVEYTFTATITKPYKNMIGEGSCFVTQLPQSPVGTTFTFKGKFGDANQKQTFLVYHPDNTSTPFEFTKIKSLFHGTCSPIPVPATVTALPCQTVSIPISFSAVQWFTIFEPSSTACFGTITTYEYLLPSGWVLNGTTSTGSNWITGTNNITVTSDLSTSGQIQVRAVNPCGASLVKGQISTIAINRPKPPLTFTGGYAVCTSQNFQANNVPSWVSNYTWLVTPSTIFGNTNPTSNPTTVTKLANGDGDIQLTISSASCPATFVYNTQEITGKPKLVSGAPEVSGNTPPMMIYYAPGDENEVCQYQGTTFDLNYTINTTVNWSAVSHQGGPWPSWTELSEGDIYVEFFNPTQNTLVLQMDASNTCGTTSYQFGFKAIDCALRMASTVNYFKVSPNPAYNI